MLASMYNRSNTDVSTFSRCFSARSASIPLKDYCSPPPPPAILLRSNKDSSASCDLTVTTDSKNQPTTETSFASQESGFSTSTSKSFSKQFYKTRVCPFAVKGGCKRGAECTFAHDGSELEIAPDLFKTKLCTAWQKGECSESATCRFAHGRQELRFTNTIYKTRICHFWQTGFCNKGNLCRHAHGYDELRTEDGRVVTPQPPPPPRSSASLTRNALKLKSSSDDLKIDVYKPDNDQLRLMRSSSTEPHSDIKLDRPWRKGMVDNQQMKTAEDEITPTRLQLESKIGRANSGGVYSCGNRSFIVGDEFGSVDFLVEQMHDNTIGTYQHAYSQPSLQTSLLLDDQHLGYRLNETRGHRTISEQSEQLDPMSQLTQALMALKLEKQLTAPPGIDSPMDTGKKIIQRGFSASPVDRQKFQLDPDMKQLSLYRTNPATPPSSVTRNSIKDRTPTKQPRSLKHFESNDRGKKYPHSNCYSVNDKSNKTIRMKPEDIQNSIIQDTQNHWDSSRLYELQNKQLNIHDRFLDDFSSSFLSWDETTDWDKIVSQLLLRTEDNQMEEDFNHQFII